MTRYVCAFLLTFFPTIGFAAQNLSALKALKAVPEEDVKNLARIEAQDGTPTPERWHFLAHDSTAENGLKEYVVAGGEVVAARNVSQFAETLSQQDVIDGKELKVDSDKLGELAQRYAAANSASLTSVSYQLLKEGQEAQPVWRVAGMDEAGKVVGTLVVTASKGTVVSHEGFPVEPKQPKSGKKQKSALRFETESEMLVAAADEDAEWGDAEIEDLETATGSESSHAQTPSATAAVSKKKFLAKTKHSYSNHKSGRSRVRNPGNVVRRVTSPVRRIVRRILPF